MSKWRSGKSCPAAAPVDGATWQRSEMWIAMEDPKMELCCYTNSTEIYWEYRNGFNIGKYARSCLICMCRHLFFQRNVKL